MTRDEDAREVLDFALRGVSPEGWGTPTYFEDEAWDDNRYVAAWERAQELIKEVQL